jgi:dihydroorotase
MLTRRAFSRCLLAGGTTLLASRTPAVAASPQAATGQNAGETFDLLIKGGTVIDAVQGFHAALDVAVKDSKIAAVSRDIPADRARNVISAKDRIVTPGLIDIHVHCFDAVGTGTNADHYCLGRGVTTVVDAGSVGYPMIAAFVKYVVRTSVTRVMALVDIGGLGTIVGIKDVMKNLDWVNTELTAKAANENKPSVVGIKVRLQQSIEGNNDIECLRRALQAAEASRIPLMVHIDDPYSPMPDILKMLRKGDVVTHYLNGHSHGILDPNGKIWPEALEARQRGVIFDPAQGSSHFSFDVAERSLKQGFLPDTISTDLVSASAFGPVYDLPTQISKFMALGIDLNKAIEMATAKPAEIFDYGTQLGTLKLGAEADISVFEVQEGNFSFADSDHQTRSGRQMLVSKVVVRRGQVIVNS